MGRWLLSPRHRLAGAGGGEKQQLTSVIPDNTRRASIRNLEVVSPQLGIPGSVHPRDGAGTSPRNDKAIVGVDTSDFADLFPGYQSRWINTSSGRIFARIGGEGPPLLLLHGFSSTHVMWHPVVSALADKFTLIIADLPGYGWSDMPESDAEHTPYTKRTMAKAMVEAMELLGYVHFALAGHDRGGRVSYRLALDHPGRLSKLAVLDILPTYDYWERMNRAYALKIYHWTFLAQPYPLPETLVAGAGESFLKQKMASQTKTNTLDAVDPRALEHYLAPFRDPARIHAMCEDYRAGASADYEIDKADFGGFRAFSA
jgi:haloacetate dehalogenase